MDARIMENEARVRASERQWRDRQALTSSERDVRKYASVRGKWLKGLSSALLLITSATWVASILGMSVPSFFALLLLLTLTAEVFIVVSLIPTAKMEG